MFTREYLELCFQEKGWWKQKAVIGDWYADWTPPGDVDVVSEDKLDQIEYTSGRYSVIPDVDDLLDFMNQQIKAWGDDPNARRFKLTYDTQDKWCCEIRYAGRITFCANQNSIHEVLYKALKQMIRFDLTRWERVDLDSAPTA